MSYYIENTWYRVLSSQLFLILYAILAAFLGINIKTFIIIMVLIIITSYIQGKFLSKGPLGGSSVKVEEVMSAKRLYEEKNLREIQMKDEGLLRDMQPQFRYMMLLNLGLLVGLLYFFLAWGRIGDLHSIFYSFTGNEKIASFLAFLIYMEGFFIINQASMILALKRVGKVLFIVYPNEYIVTVKGIVYKGLLSNTAIGFPLPQNVNAILDTNRGFVDLVNEGKRTTSIIRLYSRNPKRVYEIIKKHGFKTIETS
ncbi:MAG: DUF2208 family protein [Acidilobaceae archaeon]